MLKGEGLDDDSGAAEKRFGLAHAFRGRLAFDHERKFQKIRGADPADVGGMNPYDEGWGLRLPEEDGDKAEVSRIIWEGRVRRTAAQRGPGMGA